MILMQYHTAISADIYLRNMLFIIGRKDTKLHQNLTIFVVE